MYILHSFDQEHRRLYREARALLQKLHPDFDLKQYQLWAIVNLHFCKSNVGSYDDSFQSSMYSQVSIPHYLWTYEDALCLDDVERKHCYIVIENKNGHVLLGRYGSFEPEWEEEQVYYFCPNKPWLSLREVSALDDELGDILRVLGN